MVVVSILICLRLQRYKEQICLDALTNWKNVNFPNRCTILFIFIQLPQVRKPAFYLHYLHLTPSQLTFVEIYLAPDQQKLTFVEIYLAPDYKILTLVIHESHDKRGEPSQKNPKAWDKSGEPPRDDGELRFFHGEPPHEQVQEVQQKQPL